MKALPLWQAWLAGVLHGDGWCTHLTLGLRVKDAEFALTFASAINELFDLGIEAKQDERGYWLVRVSNKTARFDHLRDYQPTTDAGRARWLRGLFDSEGNANLCHQPQISPSAFSRRVAFYSTSTQTLSIADAHLTALGFRTVLREQRPSAGHKGAKPVYQLRLCCGREQFDRFASLIGSSISRKQSVLEALAPSYQPPGHHARISRLGTRARWST